MNDETGTITEQADARSVADCLFGGAAEGEYEPVVESMDANDGNTGDAAIEELNDSAESAGEGPAVDDDGDRDEETGTVDEPGVAKDTGGQPDTPAELKVVVSVRGGRATVGVQRPSADPHIEIFDGLELLDLAQQVPAVVERARARWEESPQHPAYERPAPPARQRNRRQQAAAPPDDAEAREAEQPQAETLRLF